MFSLQSVGAGRGEKESRLNWGEGGGNRQMGAILLLLPPRPWARGQRLAAGSGGAGRQRSTRPPSPGERASVPEGCGLG